MYQVASTGLSEVQRFVKGLEHDKEAVLAGLTVIHSNGQVEGQVNQLKLIKGQGYGRAGFPLLRQRVLHALEAPTRFHAGAGVLTCVPGSRGRRRGRNDRSPTLRLLVRQRSVGRSRS